MVSRSGYEMSHHALKAIQEPVRHVFAAGKIKKSKDLSRYHTMMRQKVDGGKNKPFHPMQNLGYDVTMTLFDMIKFGKSVLMII